MGSPVFRRRAELEQQAARAHPGTSLLRSGEPEIVGFAQIQLIHSRCREETGVIFATRPLERMTERQKRLRCSVDDSKPMLHSHRNASGPLRVLWRPLLIPQQCGHNDLLLSELTVRRRCCHHLCGLSCCSGVG